MTFDTQELRYTDLPGLSCPECGVSPGWRFYSEDAFDEGFCCDGDCACPGRLWTVKPAVVTLAWRQVSDEDLEDRS
jgi:hypothetical protein